MDAVVKMTFSKKPVKLFFKVFIALSFLFYVSAAGNLYLRQPQLVYKPSLAWKRTPQDAGLGYENVLFKSADGVLLSGWFVKVKDARGVILICHGNAGNISDWIDEIKVYHDLSFSVFVFDYRGFGKSGDAPLSEKGTALDAAAAWDYLVNEKRIDPKNIIVMGRSLGAAVAAELAAKKNPRAFILESGFTSLSDIGSEKYPYFPIRLFVRYRYDTAKHLSRIVCPVLVIHSPEDEIVPFRHGEKLFLIAREPKKFFEMQGEHNDGYLDHQARYREGLKGFLVSIGYSF